MGGADAELSVARGSGDVGLEQAAGVGGGGDDGGVDDLVEIFFSAIEGGKEAALVEVRNGAGDVALVDAALLEGLGRRESVLRVEGRVAEEEVELAVVVVGGGFGDDLHLAAAGVVVLRGVGILVDADLLNGRGGDGGAVGFDAIDHEAGAAGGGGTVVEERAHGGLVIVVEDGQGLEVASGHDAGVVVVGGICEVLVAVGGNFNC